MAKTANSIRALWKQGWNEIPEVMGSGMFGLIGLAGVCVLAYRYLQAENKTKRYKMYYTIMRPNDEKVKMLWRHDNSPPFTSTKGSGSGLEHMCKF